MISDRIRYRRKELHLSRIELAKKINVTQSAIANYENGISIPRPEILVKLCHALNVDFNYLFQDETRKIHTMHLQDDEIRIIELYRHFNENEKEILYNIIDSIYKSKKDS